MKKLFMFVGLFCLVAALFGQGKKVVLVEEFTNTGCGPCAKVNPALDSTLNVKLGDAISIKYHVNWPDRNDPMYLQNSVDAGVRTAYYSVSGVPFIAIDGTGKESSQVSVYIDERKKMEQAFEIGVTYSISESKLLTVNSTITASEAVSGENLRFFAVVIEEDIEFEKAASNGEKEFFNVMRKMLPNAQGFALPSQITKGQQFTTTDTWQIEDNSFYKIEEMAIVAFIQDISSKNVWQAFYFPKVNNSVDEASVIVAEDMPHRICVPEFSANVMVRNNGSNLLTSCKLNVDINGSIKQIPWSGSLKSLESEMMNTGLLTDFELIQGGINDVKMWLTDINGTAKTSTEYVNKFRSSLSAEGQVELLIFTDKKPTETSWKVLNSKGETIDEGGNYTEERKTYKEMVNFKIDDCYRVVFYDTGGDGICCANGNGYIKLTQMNTDGTSKEIYKGYYSGSEFTVSFNMANVIPVSVSEVGNKTLKVYPNPSNGRFTIDIATESDFTASVYDYSGKLVKQIKMTDNELNLTDLPNGVYAVQFISKDIISTNKIIINK